MQPWRYIWLIYEVFGRSCRWCNTRVDEYKLKPVVHERRKHKDRSDTKTKHDIFSGTFEDTTTRIFLRFVFRSALGLCLDYDLILMLTTTLMSQAWLHSFVLPFILSLYVCLCSCVNHTLYKGWFPLRKICRWKERTEKFPLSCELSGGTSDFKTKKTFLSVPFQRDISFSGNQPLPSRNCYTIIYITSVHQWHDLVEKHQT